MKKFITVNSLLLFFAITFAISWTGIFLSFGRDGPRIFQAEHVLAGEYSRQLIWIWLSMIAGPAVCGVFFTATIDGKHLARLIVKWTVHIKWYQIKGV